MTWNYRLVEKVDEMDGYTYQGIYEVYYDDLGEPSSVTATPVPLIWTAGESTHLVLQQIQEAFNKPILHWDDIVNKEVF